LCRFRVPPLADSALLPTNFLQRSVLRIVYMVGYGMYTTINYTHHHPRCKLNCFLERTY
jgi:hypothetical protein